MVLHLLQSALRTAADIKRRLTRSDARAAADYLARHADPCLHIGGGPRCLEGWLNTDLQRATGVISMDATRAYPFGDATFAYVFSEHMIEHVGYDCGQTMLRECFRVLRPGGVIRIVTPDLAVITGLAQEPRSPMQQAYFDYCAKEFIAPGQPRTLACVADALFRGWGHSFIYDQETLEASLAAAGFTGISRHRLGRSEHAALERLEHETRYPAGLLDFESMALEARKPENGTRAP